LFLRGRLPAAAITAVISMLFLPAVALGGFGDRTLRKGSSGHDVRVLQSWLTHLGIPTGVDGEFGTGTARRVRQFERHNGLKVNSTVEPSQARLMRRLMEKKYGKGGAPEAAPAPAPRGKARISGRRAIAPADAPESVKRAIAYANRITTKPYRYGGGHASFSDSGYDCSGAVSYALRGARLLSRPMDSGELMSWGHRGRGRWITVYAHGGHAYVVIAGLRFDTSGRGEEGPRWRREARSTAGYTARHAAGL
jgi:hypothetical protein